LTHPAYLLYTFSMTENLKVMVSRRAVIQRVNRKLDREGMKLVTARNWQDQINCGRYYAIDVSLNCVAWPDCHLEEMAREHGCLKAWEKLAAE
jgi:hypothetical protein